MELKHRKVGPRTMMTFKGQPVQIGLVMRPSASAPSRIKAALVMAATTDEGDEGIVPLPFAQATIAPRDRKPRGYTPEFRLELN